MKKNRGRSVGDCFGALVHDCPCGVASPSHGFVIYTTGSGSPVLIDFADGYLLGSGYCYGYGCGYGFDCGCSFGFDWAYDFGCGCGCD